MSLLLLLFFLFYSKHYFILWKDKEISRRSSLTAPIRRHPIECFLRDDVARKVSVGMLTLKFVRIV